MKTKKNLRDCVETIFRYEYSCGIYGMQSSEFTDDIVKHEVNRVVKHRKELDLDKQYMILRSSNRLTILSISSLEDVHSYLNNIWGDIYIVMGGKVATLDDCTDGISVKVINGENLENAQR